MAVEVQHQECQLNNTPGTIQKNPEGDGLHWIASDGKTSHTILLDNVKAMLLSKKEPAVLMKLTACTEKKVADQTEKEAAVTTAKDGEEAVVVFLLKFSTPQGRKVIADWLYAKQAERAAATATTKNEKQERVKSELVKTELVPAADAADDDVQNNKKKFTQRHISNWSELRQLYASLYDDGLLNDDDLRSIYGHLRDLDASRQPLGIKHVTGALNALVDPATGNIRPLTEQLISDVFRQVPALEEVYKKQKINSQEDEILFWEAVIQRMFFYSTTHLDKDLDDATVRHRKKEQEQQQKAQQQKRQQQHHQQQQQNVETRLVDATLVGMNAPVVDHVPCPGFGTRKDPTATADGVTKMMAPSLAIATEWNQLSTSALQAEEALGNQPHAGAARRESVLEHTYLEDLDATSALNESLVAAVSNRGVASDKSKKQQRSVTDEVKTTTTRSRPAAGSASSLLFSQEEICAIPSWGNVDFSAPREALDGCQRLLHVPTSLGGDRIQHHHQHQTQHQPQQPPQLVSSAQIHTVIDLVRVAWVHINKGNLPKASTFVELAEQQSKSLRLGATQKQLLDVVKRAREVVRERTVGSGGEAGACHAEEDASAPKKRRT